MKLLKLQNDYKKTKKLRVKRLLEDWKNIEEIFYYQDLPYVLKIICFEQITKHYDNLLTGYFEIKKTQKLITQKHYWPTL